MRGAHPVAQKLHGKPERQAVGGDRGSGIRVAALGGVTVPIQNHDRCRHDSRGQARRSRRYRHAAKTMPFRANAAREVRTWQTLGLAALIVVAAFVFATVLLGAVRSGDEVLYRAVGRLLGRVLPGWPWW